MNFASDFNGLGRLLSLLRQYSDARSSSPIDIRSFEFVGVTPNRLTFNFAILARKAEVLNVVSINAIQTRLLNRQFAVCSCSGR